MPDAKTTLARLSCASTCGVASECDSQHFLPLDHASRTASFKLLVVEARARRCTRYKQLANIHYNLPLHLFLCIIMIYTTRNAQIEHSGGVLDLDIHMQETLQYEKYEFHRMLSISDDIDR
jgi:hypothetical protein